MVSNCHSDLIHKSETVSQCALPDLLLIATRLRSVGVSGWRPVVGTDSTDPSYVSASLPGAAAPGPNGSRTCHSMHSIAGRGGPDLVNNAKHIQRLATTHQSDPACFRQEALTKRSFGAGGVDSTTVSSQSTYSRRFNLLKLNHFWFPVPRLVAPGSSCISIKQVPWLEAVHGSLKSTRRRESIYTRARASDRIRPIPHSQVWAA